MTSKGLTSSTSTGGYSKSVSLTTYNLLGASNAGATSAGNTATGVYAVKSTENMNEHTPEKIKDISLSKASKALETVFKTPLVPFLWGPPGIGKSTLARDIATKNNWKLIDLRLSLLNPVDLRGLPVINKKRKVADWYSPSFLPKKGDPAGLLFLDEINLAPLSVQAAAYQLILDKRVGEYAFPDNWKIMAAGNRETDRANVYKLPAPLANRFIHFSIQPDYNSWIAWAKDNIREEVLEFITFQKPLLFRMPKDSEKAFPTPRSWHFVSDLLTAYDFMSSKDKVSKDLQSMIVGAIGRDVGITFIEFLGDYRLREFSNMIKKFSKTGKITMPKSNAIRFGLIEAIYQNFKTGELGERLYHKFLKKLDPEELEAVRKFEEENMDKINQRWGNLNPVKGQENVFLNNSISAGGNEITIYDPENIVVRKTDSILLYNGSKRISNNYHHKVEAVRYQQRYIRQATSYIFTISNVERGLEGTTPRSWPVGTLIQALGL